MGRVLDRMNRIYRIEGYRMIIRRWVPQSVIPIL
jgi:hypothetical protein